MAGAGRKSLFCPMRVRKRENQGNTTYRQRALGVCFSLLIVVSDSWMKYVSMARSEVLHKYGFNCSQREKRAKRMQEREQRMEALQLRSEL